MMVIIFIPRIPRLLSEKENVIVMIGWLFNKTPDLHQRRQAVIIACLDFIKARAAALVPLIERRLVVLLNSDARQG